MTVEALTRAPQLCLIDTGSLHNRFGAWIARAAGIGLRDARDERIGIDGFTTSARAAITRVTLGGETWEAPVWFCDPWPLAFQVVEQEAVFRWFAVRLRAAVYEIEVTPER